MLKTNLKKTSSSSREQISDLRRETERERETNIYHLILLYIKSINIYEHKFHTCPPNSVVIQVGLGLTW